MTDKTDKHDLSEAELAVFLAAGRREKPPVPPDLQARVLADADRVAASARAVKTPVLRRVPVGLLRAIGGWPALAGLAMAAVAGIWIGFAAPAGLGGFAQGFLGGGENFELHDFMPVIDALALEG